MVLSPACFLPCWDNAGHNGIPRLWQRSLEFENPILDCYTTACQNSVLRFLTMLVRMVQTLPLFVLSWAADVRFLQGLGILSSLSSPSKMQSPHILLVSGYDRFVLAVVKGPEPVFDHSPTSIITATGIESRANFPSLPDLHHQRRILSTRAAWGNSG